MTKKMLVLVLSMSVMLVACKLVNTHVVKVTGAAEFSAADYVLVKTTKGNVYLSTQSLSDRGREVLQTIRLNQCLAITTSEPFDMHSREVHFTTFKLKKLLEADSACRKIKGSRGLYVN